MKGSDIIKKTYPEDEEKFRAYLRAIDTQILILEKTIIKFQGKLKQEKELKAEALKMTLEKFKEKHDKGELSPIYPKKKK